MLGQWLAAKLELAAEFRSGGAEDPGEDGLDMPGVIAEVELLVDLGRRSERAATSGSAFSSARKSAPCCQTFIALRCTAA